MRSLASVVTCLPYEILLPCFVALHPAMWSLMALAHAFERSLGFRHMGGSRRDAADWSTSVTSREAAALTMNKFSSSTTLARASSRNETAS